MYIYKNEENKIVMSSEQPVTKTIYHEKQIEEFKDEFIPKMQDAFDEETGETHQWPVLDENGEPVFDIVKVPITRTITESEEVLADGWEETDQNVICGWDGGLHFEGKEPIKPEPNPRETILAEITALESCVTQRTLRGAALSNKEDLIIIQNVEYEIQLLRDQLAELED